MTKDINILVIHNIYNVIYVATDGKLDTNTSNKFIHSWLKKPIII